MRKYMSVLMLILLFQAVPVGGQNLKLPISNYTNKVYGRNYEATNYCIITDHRNLVYTGNANGIMEYDGSEWRFIPVRQGAYVTSLNISPEGIILVGSQQDFGLLSPDQGGSLQYHSLAVLLPEEDRFFSTIWTTLAGEGITAFQAEECIFIYRPDSLSAIYPETSFHTSFLLGSDLYVRERGSGLKVLREDKFELVNGGSVFADLGIFGMFPYGDKGDILIATNEKGFYLYDPQGGIEPIPGENEDFLLQSGIFGGIKLADGSIALNTMNEGVIICNREGNVCTIINKNSGFQDYDVKGIWQDVHHNIWCAMNNGISKIDYSSPVSFYDEDAGLEGSIQTLVRNEEKLYVGTTSGLFVENTSTDITKPLEFNPIPGLQDQVWSLKTIGSSLLVGTANGIFEMKNGSIRKVTSMNAFAMHYLEKEKILLVGGSGGLLGFSPAKNWEKILDFQDIRVDVKTIAENHSSEYQAHEIWIGTSLQGTVKILLNSDLSYESTQYYGSADGLPEDWVLPFEHADSIVFGTRAGIMQFVDELVVRKFLPDSLRDQPDYYRGYFEGSSLYDREITLPLSFITQFNNKTFAVIDNEIMLVDHVNQGEIVEKPFKGIDLGEINYIYPDGEHTVWFAAGDGLARFDLNLMDKPTGSFRAAIRSVLTTGDSLIFNGTYELPEFYSPDNPAVLFEQPEDAVPVLNHAHNDLTFFFSSPFYDSEGKNQFSWMLDGDNSQWSNWSDRRVTSYTNLREGEYTFLVRIQNIYGDITEATGYRFIIRPPWFRTLPAYVLYILFIGLFIYSSIRLGQRRLRRKNEKLEAIVLERTEEIRHQNIELAAQKKEITDSINYAERIQRAILPHTDRIPGKIEDYFILFMPKDIVSGDFYWLAESGSKIIVTAADCTGHGVPGAFMSMLGVSFLNKIILENNILEANNILDELRNNVISSLKQTGKEGEARDGMDMALVVIDTEKMYMEFAGANNPLYMIRNDELIETKADRMPIAYYIDTENFSNNIIPLKKGDTIYLFSDGYADQFGGPAGKKLKYKPFKELLMANRGKSMQEMHKILDDTIKAWMAPNGPDGDRYEQIDDILIIGMRI